MALFKGFRRLTDAQFGTISIGGTVQGETYDEGKIYATPVRETEVGVGLKIEDDTLKLDLTIEHWG